MQDDGAVELAERSLRLGSGRARMDDEWQLERGGELQVSVEQSPLGVVRRVVAVVVEPGLADRDCTLVVKQGA